MNSLLTPLPAENDAAQADCVKWFIGYMPVSGEGSRADTDVRPFPALPDFSTSPTWAASTNLAFAPNPFTGGFRPASMEPRTLPEEMPQVVENEGVCYTDEDLHEVLADLMVSDEEREREVPTASGDIAPMLRAAARRAVAEMVDPHMRCDVPMSFRHVCGGIKAMIARWISYRSVGETAPMWQVVGLQIFRKSPSDLIISTGEIPLVAEKEIVRSLEDGTGRTDDSLLIDGNRKVQFVAGGAHILAAIVHGEADETMVEDLAYLLRRIEMRMERQPAADNARDASIRSLLQEGLLIRAPMTTALEERAVAM